MSTLTATQLQQQYIAYFGRPGDPAGIKYWLSSSSGVSSAREFADKIYAQDEYKKSTVGSKSTEEQINGLYVNLFDRQADAAGLLYWTNQVENGTLTLSNIAFDLIAAASAPVAGNETQAALDAQALSNKVSAATSYTAEIEASTTAILAYQPSSTSPWVTGSAFEAGVTFLKTATSSNAPTAADVTSSVTTMSSTTGVAEGSNFTLSATTDNVVGTAGNDSITGSSSTFNSDDSIKGGAGSDSFTVTAAAAGTVIGNFEAVETLKVTNGSGTASDDYAINLIGATGVTEVQSRLSSAEVSFDNVQAAATVSSFGSQSGSAISATFLNSLTSGTADSISLKVDGGANTEFNISGTDAANEFETINLESAGSIKNTVSAIKDNDGTPQELSLLEAINVTGTGDLKITLGATKTGAVYDGSAATGDQTVVWGGGFETLTTGSGNDQIDASAGGFLDNTNPKAIDGGAGTDTLTLSESVDNMDTTSSLTDHSITGFETLEVEATNVEGGTDDIAYTVAVDKFTGITSLKATIDNQDSAAGGGDGEDTTVTYTGIGTQTISFTSEDAGVSGNDNFLALTLLDDTGASDVVNLTSAQPAAGKVNYLSALTLNRTANAANTLVETVNLTVSAADVSTTDGTTLELLDLTYANQLNILGSEDLTLTSLEIRDPSGTTNAIIDASAYTGDLTTGAAFKASSADNLTVKLGSGTNKVYLDAGVNVDDVVEGSTGTDTVKILDTNTAVGSDTTGTTVKDVDIVQIYSGSSAGATAISLVNFSNVDSIRLYDAGQGHSTNDSITVTNAAAGQKFQMRTDPDSNVSQDWDGATLDIDNKKGEASTLDLELAGGQALEPTAILNTDAATVTLTDSIKVSGFYVDNSINIEGNSTTEEITALVLKGGGAASATATAVLDIDDGGNGNVSIASIDASALASDLNIVGLTTAAGATITGASSDNKYTVSLADLARDAITLDGGDGTDTLAAAGLTTATYVPGVSNVEKFDLDILDDQAGDVVIDGSDASSVTELKLSLGAAAGTNMDYSVTVQNFASLATIKTVGGLGTASGDSVAIDDTGATTIATADETAFLYDGLTLADATSLTIKLGSSNTGVTAAEFTATALTANKVTTLTLGGSDTDTAGTQWVGKINIPTSTANALTDLTINTGQGDVDLHTITAAKLANVTVTGDNALAFGDTAAETTLLASFDGSAATGPITIGESVDFTSTASVKTGTGNDDVTLSVTTEATLSLDMGEKTSDTDTLRISGANNLGVTVFDLSAADQILQINGVTATGSETGIENVNLSGLTGTQGSSITGNADVNVIVGSINADIIVPGEEADDVTGGLGDDTIDLQETTAKADRVFFDQLTGLDTITNFAVNSDTITFDGMLGIDGSDADDIEGFAANATIVTTGDQHIYVIANGADMTGTDAASGLAVADGDYADTATGKGAVAAALELSFSGIEAHAYVFAINDLTGDDVHIYYCDVSVDGNTANQIDAGDLTKIGVINDIGSTALDADDVFAFA